jgi:hypothetical protein
VLAVNGGNVTMLSARTLAEAHIYLALRAAEETIDGANITVTEGEQGWTVACGSIAVLVPYRSEVLCRQSEVVYGFDQSSLVDAAEWVMVASSYAQRALAGDVRSPRTPDEVLTVERDWLHASEAQLEAVKLLVHSEPSPAAAVWSATGRQMLAETPEQLDRTKVAEDSAYYRGTLDDFRALHGLPR